MVSGRRHTAWVLALFALACNGTTAPTGSDGEAPLRLVASLSGAVVHLTAPPGDDRLFVVEQAGRIRIIRGDVLLPAPFLDLTDRVGTGSERGLLSMAFQPDFGVSGLFYVYYTNLQGDTRVERYRVSDDPDVADRSSAHTILAVDQPFSNHNGGLIVFDSDGLLYIGLGDGGSGGDPQGNGQNPATLLGSILRIDVSSGDPYGIPPGNPYADGMAGRPEIWAIGLRNPWRFAFDPVAGLLYVADVGQNQWEEINVVAAGAGGLNYGWNEMEGLHCYPGGSACNPQAFTLPVLEYGHGEGCSVTGGMVYRGDAVPDLAGHYVYADYCAGWIRSFRYDGAAAREQREWPVGEIGAILGFGSDAAGELYVLSLASGTGRVYRVVDSP